jgi:hypothetical protein
LVDFLDFDAGLEVTGLGVGLGVTGLGVGVTGLGVVFNDFVPFEDFDA